MNRRFIIRMHPSTATVPLLTQVTPNQPQAFRIMQSHSLKQ